MTASGAQRAGTADVAAFDGDIQAALNYVSGQGGGRVWVPEGLYQPGGSGFVIPSSNIHVMCSPGATIDMSTASSSAFVASATGTVIASGNPGYAALQADTVPGAVSVVVTSGAEAAFKSGDKVQLGSNAFGERRTAAQAIANTGQFIGEFNEVIYTQPGLIVLRRPLSGWVDTAGGYHMNYLQADGAFIRKVNPIENVSWTGGTLLGKPGKSLTGVLAAGSDVATNVFPSTDGLDPAMIGKPVAGTGVPVGATLAQVLSPTSFRMSLPADTSTLPSGTTLLINGNSQLGLVFSFAHKCYVSFDKAAHFNALALQFLGSTHCGGGSSERVSLIEDSWGTLGYGIAASAGSEDITFTNFHMHNCRHAFTLGGAKDTYGFVKRVTLLACHAENTHPTTGDQFDTHACGLDIHFIDIVSIGSGGSGINIECASAKIRNAQVIRPLAFGIGAANYTYYPTSYDFDCEVIEPKGRGIRVAPGAVIRTAISTIGQPQATGLVKTDDLVVGQGVTSAAFPAGTTVLNIDSSSQVTLSAAATVTGQAITGTTVNGQATITGSGYTDSTLNLAALCANSTTGYAGAVVTGPGLPGGTHLLEVTNDTTLTVSNPAGAAAGAGTFNIGAAALAFYQRNDWRQVRISGLVYQPGAGSTAGATGVEILGQKGSEIHGALDITGLTIDRPTNASAALWVGYCPGASIRAKIKRTPPNNSGARLENADGMSAKLTVRYETVGTGKGISLNGVTDSVLSDSAVKNAGTGIFQDNACAGNVLAENVTPGCTTRITVGTGPRHLVRNNPGNPDRNVTANAAFNSGDYKINVTNTTANRTITAPAWEDMNPGQEYVLKDASGGAAAHNITLVPATVKSDGTAVSTTNTIEGLTSYPIVANYGFIRFYAGPTAGVLVIA